MKPVIITVDDSEIIRRQIEALLAPHGYEIAMAVDGAQGLEQIEAHPDAVLVLCDISMPRMDGMTMLEEVSRRYGAAMPPIIMLTTERSSAKLQQARQAGAIGWIVKPFRPELLVETARKIIASQPSGGAPARGGRDGHR